MEIKHKLHDRKKIPQDTSPRAKQEEKQEKRPSIQANRERSVKHLAESVRVPNFTDFVTLSTAQKVEWKEGRLQFDKLTRDQKKQANAYEKAVSKALARHAKQGEEVKVESPRKESLEATQSSLSPAMSPKVRKLKVLSGQTGHEPSTSKDKPSPRIETQGHSPRVAGVPVTPIPERNWPRSPQSTLLMEKIRLQQQEIEALQKLLHVKNRNLELLEQKLGRLAVDSFPSPRTSRHLDFQAKGEHDSSSELSEIIEKMIPSDAYRKQ